MRRIRDEVEALLHAVQFLTRWPLPATIPYSGERFAAAARYYPLVGALIGAFAGAVFWLAHLVFPVTTAVAISPASDAIVAASPTSSSPPFLDNSSDTVT